MNRCFVLVFLLTAMLSSRAEGPDDRYVQIYNLIQEADGLNDSGQAQPALAKYLEAQNALQQFLAAHPSWNEKLVRFRIDYVAAKLAPLALKFPATNAPPRLVNTATNAGNPVSGNQVRLWQDEVNRLTAQNTLLEAKLKEAWSVQPAATDSAEVKRSVEKTRQLERENELLKVALSQEQARNATPPDNGLSKPEKQLAMAKAANRQLEQENESLKKKLSARSVPVAAGDAERQLEVLKARLQVYEANPVPYSSEELALVKQPGPNLAATNPAAVRKRPNEPPPGAGSLMTDAMRAIEAGQFEEAEKKLQLILRQDERNLYTLTHLAGVQLDLDHLADAEKTLKQALSVDPRDPIALYLVGRLKYRQEKFDEALDALSVSASLDPEKPLTQYYLGKTLVNKGNRRTAETAFRKALQLMPRWPDAHYMLAEIYTLQQPPYLQLAQWHYKRALEGGVARNAQLEKIMEGKAPPTANP